MPVHLAERRRRRVKIVQRVHIDPSSRHRDDQVGLAEAKAKNIEVAIGKFQLAGNGRAIASDCTSGFVKVIACAKTDKLLGVQMVAKGASEMIAAACAHMEYGGSAEDVARTCFAHPTVSESFKEAAMAVSKSSIHSL